MKTCTHCPTPLPGWLAERTTQEFGAPLCLTHLPDCSGRLDDLRAFVMARRAVRRLGRLEYGSEKKLRLVEGGAE